MGSQNNFTFMLFSPRPRARRGPGPPHLAGEQGARALADPGGRGRRRRPAAGRPRHLRPRLREGQLRGAHHPPPSRCEYRRLGASMAQLVTAVFS